jgi:glycosyltransferase involved in cell wall biosynthesis
MGAALPVRILIVHNEYGKFSGEEAVVAAHKKVLEEHHHEVLSFQRTSACLEGKLGEKIQAFFSGVYSPASRGEIRRLLQEHVPDVVHVHNLYPWISPSILLECHRVGVPIVMTVHNYRLVCPNGLHLPKGRYEVCEKCCGGREYWCVLRDCEKNFFKSLGYALRTYTARRFGFIKRNVAVFACLTEFQRRRLLAEGYPAERLRVVPNMCPTQAQTPPARDEKGEFVAYAGRISPEKGIELLLSAAARLKSIPFHLAGDYDAVPALVRKAPANMSFLGRLDRPRLADFYNRSRLLVLSSTWFEGFPMVLVEAMVHAKPLIAPRIGGIPEIVDEGRTGLLFTPGDAGELTEKIRYLWDHPELGWQMGHAGREKALREYSSEKHYDRLMTIYEDAMKFCSGNSRRRS